VNKAFEWLVRLTVDIQLHYEAFIEGAFREIWKDKTGSAARTGAWKLSADIQGDAHEEVLRHRAILPTVDDLRWLEICVYRGILHAQYQYLSANP
jgi:hypothetical protein